MHQLTEKADCVLPIENQALIDITNKIYGALPPSRPGKRVYPTRNNQVKSNSTVTSSEGGATKTSQEKPFDHMNNIVANLLLNMTSSARFEGSLNVDLNEITMNLVPFPKLHYLVSSLTPLYSLIDVNLPVGRLDQMFTDAFSKDYQLIKANPKHSLYLACALIVRGKAEVSDIRRNIERLKPNLKFIHWNQGWKTGLCSVAPVGQPYSLLALANNTCIQNTFQNLRDRFTKLYKRKAHVHHYNHVDGFEQSMFDDSLESLDYLIGEYKLLQGTLNNPGEFPTRLTVL